MGAHVDPGVPRAAGEDEVRRSTDEVVELSQKSVDPAQDPSAPVSTLFGMPLPRGGFPCALLCCNSGSMDANLVINLLQSAGHVDECAPCRLNTAKISEGVDPEASDEALTVSQQLHPGTPISDRLCCTCM